jgi:hypothetical protein
MIIHYAYLPDYRVLASARRRRRIYIKKVTTMWLRSWRHATNASPRDGIALFWLAILVVPFRQQLAQRWRVENNCGWLYSPSFEVGITCENVRMSVSTHTEDRTRHSRASRGSPFTDRLVQLPIIIAVTHPACAVFIFAVTLRKAFNSQT